MIRLLGFVQVEDKEYYVYQTSGGAGMLTEDVIDLLIGVGKGGSVVGLQDRISTLNLEMVTLNNRQIKTLSNLGAAPKSRVKGLPDVILLQGLRKLAIVSQKARRIVLDDAVKQIEECLIC